MFTKFYNPTRTVAIIGLVFALASFTAWAAISHNDTDDGIILTNLNIAPQIPDATPNHDLFIGKPPKDDGGGGSEEGTSFVVKKGKGSKTEYLVRDGEDKIGVKVWSQSLDAYMEEQDISSVEITVDLVEQWVKTDTGGHYCLEFTFSPHGAFFN